MLVSKHLSIVQIWIHQLNALTLWPGFFPLLYILYVFDIKGKMSPLVLKLISWLSKRVFEPTGKEKFCKIFPDWVYNGFKPWLGFLKGFQQLLPLQILEIIDICRLYICSYATHMPCISSLHFEISLKDAFYNSQKKTKSIVNKVHVCAAQFISQLDTAALSSLPACPLYSPEFIFNVIAQLVFNLWRVFSLAASLCSNSILATDAILHSCRSPHEGFAAPQFLLFSARPVRKANSLTTGKENLSFTSFQDLYSYTKKPYSYTRTINILFLLLRKHHY